MKHRTDDNRRFALACADVSGEPPPGLAPRDPPVSEQRAAWILGLTEKQLADKRRRGTGPVCHMRAKAAVYLPSDIGAWSEARAARFASATRTVL